MDKEYIERGVLLKTPPFTKHGGELCEYVEGYLDCAEDARKAVKDAPAADVKPVVRGEWKPVSDNSFGKNYVCSKCFTLASACNGDYYDLLTPFCPYCGATMKGVSSNE